MSFFRGLAGFLSWGLCLVLAGISALAALVFYLLDYGQLHVGVSAVLTLLLTILGFVLLIGLTMDADEN